jgi:hypothetical protein
MSWKLVPQVVLVCAIFHNLILNEGDELENEIDLTEQNDDPEPIHDEQEDGYARANEIRDALCEFLNNE